MFLRQAPSALSQGLDDRPVPDLTVWIQGPKICDGRDSPQISAHSCPVIK